MMLSLRRRAAGVLLSGLFLWLCPVAVALAQDFQLKSETIVRAFERVTSSGAERLLFPAYEYLRLDAAPRADRRLSFHAYGWLRGDLADSGYFDQMATGELLYAYLEYRPAFTNSLLRIGRQTVYTGVANDPFDGLRVAGDLGRYFHLSLHGGQPVGYSTANGRSGDLLYGGRFAHHLGSLYEIGLSYQRQRNDSNDVEEAAAADVRIALPGSTSLSGYVSRNLDTSDWGEQHYALRTRLAALRVHGYYDDVDYAGYFSAVAPAPQPFRNLALTNEQLERYGLDLFLPLSDRWEVGLRGTYSDYAVKPDDGRYAALLLDWRGDGRTRAGAEVGWLDARAINDDQLLLRASMFLDNLPQAAWLEFASAEVMHVSYDQGFFGETRSLFVSVGVGRSHLDNVLEWKLSGDYSRDPYFDTDFRGMLIVTLRYPG